MKRYEDPESTEEGFYEPEEMLEEKRQDVFLVFLHRAWEFILAVLGVVGYIILGLLLVAMRILAKLCKKLAETLSPAIKQEKVLRIVGGVVAIWVVIAMLFALFTKATKSTPVEVSANVAVGAVKIAIAPGHGLVYDRNGVVKGYSGGVYPSGLTLSKVQDKVSVDSYIEAMWTREFSEQLKIKLEVYGYDVLITAPDVKNADAEEQASAYIVAQVTEASKWGADLILTVHSNGMGGETGQDLSGAFALVDTGVNYSMLNARAIVNCLKAIEPVIGISEHFKLAAGTELSAPSFLASYGANGGISARSAKDLMFIDTAMNRFDIPNCVFLEMGEHDNDRDRDILVNKMPELASALARGIDAAFGTTSLDSEDGVKVALIEKGSVAWTDKQTKAAADWMVQNNTSLDREYAVRFIKALGESFDRAGLNKRVALAQVWLETNYLSSDLAKQNNFAGIAADGTGAAPLAFDSMLFGIQALREHWEGYVFGNVSSRAPVNTRMQTLISSTWFLDNIAGKVRYVDDLAGTWATDPDYAEKLYKKLARISALGI